MRIAKINFCYENGRCVSVSKYLDLGCPSLIDSDLIAYYYINLYQNITYWLKGDNSTIGLAIIYVDYGY